MAQRFAVLVANRPRVYCPKCSKPARRIYYQDATKMRKGESPSGWSPIAGWAYCDEDDLAFQHEKA